MTQGIDPYEYLYQLSAQLDGLENRQQLETVLDELEYLFQVIDPELQDSASDLIARLRSKLKANQ